MGISYSGISQPFLISIIDLYASALVTLIISGTMTTHGRTSGWPKGTNPVSYAAKYGITNPSPTLDRPINLYVFIN